MSSGTHIHWTDATWNPVTGCTRVSAGCDHCYAVGMSHRLAGMGQEKYAGLTVLNQRGERHFNGTVRCHEDSLGVPLNWRKARRIFVNSMSDLFHRDVPFDFIDRVFAVMALCPQHVFQVLTKRPERMLEYLTGLHRCISVSEKAAVLCVYALRKAREAMIEPSGIPWPLHNVWLGTSCEDQATAEERIPHLLRCPAAVRFVSCEPLLGPVDVSPWLPCPRDTDGDGNCGQRLCRYCKGTRCLGPRLDQVIVGGESGARARACNVEWILDPVRQCHAARVACFVKQVGSRPMMRADSLEGRRAGDHPELEWPEGTIFGTAPHDMGTPRQGHFVRLRDPKGADPSEWPEDIRVREYPT